MTAPTTHPAQLLLPGQAAAPEGPVDLAAMYVMHRAFRRDADAFAAAAAATPVADRRRWARLSRRFALFAGILHKHHHGEDVGLWPLLRERGADPEVLDAMQAEHAHIDPLLASCSGDLAALARGAGEETRRRLIGCTARLRDLLSAHLGHEERDGMALVQRHLGPADWQRLDREVFAKEYRPRDIPAVLAWVMSGLPDEAARRMPGANPVMLAVGRLLVRRFERAEARTFG
ncbi:hemerythrin domain-containing protein [Blastococcus deserti]|uniref:Hemerythrin domain-containing protein n=1 Tax=Blastococcus deserti TaxID=2259033 RepID=A0ABW4XDI1_9ACTN